MRWIAKNIRIFVKLLQGLSTDNKLVLLSIIVALVIGLPAFCLSINDIFTKPDPRPSPPEVSLETVVVATQWQFYLDGLLQNARNHIELGQFEQAKLNFEEYLRLQPRDAAVLNELGVVYIVLEEYSNALQTLNRAADHAPENLEIQNNIGTVHVHKSDFPAAINVFSNVISGLEQSPPYPTTITTEPYYGAGLANYYLGNYDDAVKYLTRAHELGGPDEFVLFFRGSAYFELGEFALSQLDLDEVLRINDEHVDALTLDAIIMFETELYDPALLTFKNIITFSGSSTQDISNAHRFSGMIYRAQENTTRAIESYESALLADPNNGLVHYNLGNLYQGQQDFEAARHHYLSAIDLNPSYAPAYNNLAYLYTLENDTESAIEIYSDGIRNSDLPNLYLGRGNIYEFRNALTQAANDYLKWIESIQEFEMEIGSPSIPTTLEILMQEGYVFSYEINLTVGDSISISIDDVQDGNTVDPIAVIVDSTNPGLALTGSDDREEGNFGLDINFTAEKTGTFLLLVSHAAQGSEGEITMKIEEVQR